MFHYSIFGTTEGRIPSKGFSVFTFFGFSILHQPTLAQRIQERLRPEAPRRSLFDRLTRADRGVIVTLFGSAELRAPTLMEEYSAMRGLLASGAVSVDDVRRIADALDPRDEWVALTFFGVCTTHKVGRNKQIKELDAGERAGLISREHRRQLDELIDAPTATAAGVLSRLAAATA